MLVFLFRKLRIHNSESAYKHFIIKLHVYVISYITDESWTWKYLHQNVCVSPILFALYRCHVLLLKQCTLLGHVGLVIVTKAYKKLDFVKYQLYFTVADDEILAF